MIHTLQERFKDDTFGRIGNVLHGRYHLHPVILQGVLVDRSLVLVAGKSVQLVDQNVVPLLFFDVLHHALEVGAHIVGARHSAVDVRFHDQDPVSLGVIVTNAKLTFDGLLGLVIAEIPSVDDCCFHVAFSSVSLDFVVWFCWR